MTHHLIILVLIYSFYSTLRNVLPDTHDRQKCVRMSLLFSPVMRPIFPFRFAPTNPARWAPRLTPIRWTELRGAPSSCRHTTSTHIQVHNMWPLFVYSIKQQLGLISLSEAALIHRFYTFLIANLSEITCIFPHQSNMIVRWSRVCVHLMNLSPTFSSVFGLHHFLRGTSECLAAKCSIFVHQLVYSWAGKFVRYEEKKTKQ